MISESPLCLVDVLVVDSLRECRLITKCALWRRALTPQSDYGMPVVYTPTSSRLLRTRDATDTFFVALTDRSVDSGFPDTGPLES